MVAKRASSLRAIFSSSTKKKFYSVFEMTHESAFRVATIFKVQNAIFLNAKIPACDCLLEVGPLNSDMFFSKYGALALYRSNQFDR